MNARQYRVEDLFHQAVDLSKADRDALLRSACEDDHAMRADVEALLSAAELDVGGFVARMAMETTDHAAPLPERIGEFRILRIIGEGGMGRVYEAEQQSPARRVALKVIRPGLVSSSVLRRFAHEADILAQLNHPGIAQIYQAGFAPDPARPGDSGGRMPYFAMELVEGVSLSEYVRGQTPSVRAILGLLVDVGDAVQHAHQRGVIHRDLKPSNVLVEGIKGSGDLGINGAKTDSSGSVLGPSIPRSHDPIRIKILDFGIARLTDADAARATMETQVGQIVGTLGYMSPEQTDGAAARIDTRADVYALGVIAYELLAGRPPLDLKDCSIVSAIAKVRDAEPAPLGSIRPECRGDIETIVAKAMAKEPDGRYASAGEFAADLKCVIEDRPIAARPPSTTYLVRKFARRNRGLVLAASLAVISLVVGAGVAVWQAVVATRERDVARAAETRAGRIKQFLVEDAFGQTRFDRGGVKLTVVDALLKAAERVPVQFADEPDLHAEIEGMLAVMLSDASMMQQAAEHAAKAQKMMTERYGASDARTLRVALDRIAILGTMNKASEMDRSLGEIAAEVDRVLGPTTLEAAKAQTLLAVEQLQGNKPETAAAILSAALARPYPPDVHAHISYGFMLNIMTSTQGAMGKQAEALAWSEKTVAWMAAHESKDSPHRAAVNATHGNLLASAGRYSEAEPLLRESLETQRRVLLPDDDGIGYSAMHLSMALLRMGRAAEAEPLVVEGAGIIEKTFGINDWETWLAWRREWLVLVALKDAAKLEAWHIKNVERTGRMEPRLREHALDAVRSYAEFKLTQGKIAEAETDYATVRDELAALPDDAHTRVAAELFEGMLARRQGRTEEARKKLEHAREFFVNKPFPLFPGAGDRAADELKAMGDDGAAGGK